MFKSILKLINLNLLHKDIAKIMVNFASPVVDHRLMLNISRAPAHNVIELENIMLSLCMCYFTCAQQICASPVHALLLYDSKQTFTFFILQGNRFL